MKPFLKFGIGMMLFGIIGMILISTVSYLIYGKIYVFDGYAITGVLWKICFAAVGIGVYELVLLATVFMKKPKIFFALFLLLVVFLLFVALKACSVLNEEVRELMEYY